MDMSDSRKRSLRSATELRPSGSGLRRIHGAQGRGRHGFTLFEVLVAVSLSTALIWAVYMALDLHWQYTTAGQDEVQRLQLVRAVFARMERDLRSTMYSA